jgi:soluble lytic murein transglycosylase-like protein
MKRLRPRWLIRPIVIGVIATATYAGAETSRVTTAPPAPSYRRIVYTAAPLRDARPPLSRYHTAYAREIAEAAQRYAVPERLIWAVIRVESGFDHRAVSRKGARGLMQLMPETAAILGVRDSFDPRENIHGGTRHLRALLEHFRHDVRLAVAAYNAGEKPVRQFGGVPPYPETQEYVARVLSFYGAPNDWEPAPRAGVRRIVQADGTVLYTNIPYGRVGAVSQVR